MKDAVTVGATAAGAGAGERAGERVGAGVGAGAGEGEGAEASAIVGAAADVWAVLQLLLCGQAAAAEHLANDLRVEASGHTTFGRTDAIDLFAVHPLVFSDDVQRLVSPRSLAVLGDTADGRAVGAFADLVEGVITRVWVVAATALDATAEPAVAVARDDFMSQLRQRCQGDAADHPELQSDDWAHILGLGVAALDAGPPAASSSQVWVMRAFSSGGSVAALYRLRVHAATLPRQAHDRLVLAVARVQGSEAPLHQRLALSDPLPGPAPVSL